MKTLKNKAWKQIVLILSVCTAGIFLLITILYYVEKRQEQKEQSEIEGIFKSIEQAIKENNFEATDSTIKKIDLKKVFQVENGYEKMKALEQKIISSEIKFEVDKIKQEIKQKEFALAESRLSELRLKFNSTAQLTKEDEEYLTSVSIELSTTKDSLMQPYLERAKETLVNMYEKEGKFNNITWFRDKTSPRFVNRNGFFLLFAEEKGKRVNVVYPLTLTVQYYGDSWIFYEEFQLLIDGKSYKFKPKKVIKDSVEGYVWESSSQPIKDYVSFNYMAKRLVEVINSKESKIKFIGDKFYHIKTITQKQKDALRNVLLTYIAKKGEYFKFVDEIIQL